MDPSTLRRQFPTLVAWHCRSLALITVMGRVIRIMRPFLMRLTIRRMIVGVALLAVLTAWAIEPLRRSRLRFDFYDYDVAGDEEPLVNPTGFFGLEGNRVDLAGGRFLDVEATTWRDTNFPAVPWSPGDLKRLSAGLEDELEKMRVDGAAGIVDLEARPDGRTLLYVRKRRWYCGTCLGPPPIRIPLFRRTVYRNPRLLIGIGTISKHSQPCLNRQAESPVSPASPHSELAGRRGTNQVPGTRDPEIRLASPWARRIEPRDSPE
jgi:hypothetical protein